MLSKIQAVVTILLLMVAPQIRAVEMSSSDSLWTALSVNTSAADSIRTLYNLLDVARLKEFPKVADMLYAVAERQGDNRVMFDVARQLGKHYYRNDSAVRVILNRVALLPESDERDETMTFIRLFNTTAHAEICIPAAIDDSLTQAVKALNDMELSGDENIYHRIEPLYRFCLFLGYASKGKMLTDTYDRLGKLIEETPGYPGALRSMFNVSSAIAYEGNEMYDKAMIAEKNVLATIEALQRRYDKEGRGFRNYDVTLYSTYRRILGNFTALQPEEVDDYYNRILRIASRNPDVANDLRLNPRATVYYLIYHKRYGEALPLLKKYLERKIEASHRLRMLKYLVEAAGAVGDKETTLQASLEYSGMLENRAAEKVDERTRELQVLYSVNALRQDYNRLEIEQQKQRFEEQKRLMTILVISGIVMLVLIVLLLRLYLRSRSLGHQLSQRNVELKSERDSLRDLRQNLIEATEQAKKAEHKKSEFIASMSHELINPINTIVEYSSLITDCVENDGRDYLNRFVDVVKLNARILISLVNQTLSISEIENSTLKFNITDINVRNTLLTLLEAAKPNVDSDKVKLLYTGTVGDGFHIRTDATRVAQVINNLLSNAVKFTESGTISLGAQLTPDGRKLSISVTDTGVGIPADKAEDVFKMFEKLDSEEQGYGLGLYVSRLLAKALGGSLELDTAYTDGCRFVFTIPLTINS